MNSFRGDLDENYWFYPTYGNIPRHTFFLLSGQWKLAVVPHFRAIFCRNFLFSLRRRNIFRNFQTDFPDSASVSNVILTFTQEFFRPVSIDGFETASNGHYAAIDNLAF